MNAADEIYVALEFLEALIESELGNKLWNWWYHQKLITFYVVCEQGGT